MKDYLKKFPEIVVYLFLFLIPITHPAVRVLAKLIFLIFILFLLRKKVKFLKEDVVALLFPVYQLIQSALKGKLLLFLKIPQGITPVFSYAIRFFKFSEKKGLKLLLYGISILSLSVVLQSLSGASNYRELLQIDKLQITVIRPWHTFLGHPLTAGAFTSVGFFLSVFLYTLSRQKRYLLIALITLTGTILTFDRSYWIGVVATSLISGFLYANVKKVPLKRTLLFGIPVVLLFTAAITVPQIKERLISITDVKNNGSNRYRLAMWKGGLEFYRKAPFEEKLLGTSRFNYKEEVGPFIKREEAAFNLPPHVFSHLHNDYITVLVWYGAVGLTIFLFTFGYFLYKNYLLFKTTGNEIYIALFSAYLVLLIGGLFEYNFEDESVKYLIYSLLALNVKFIDR